MDFSSALDTKAGAVEKPLNPPQGTYAFEIFKPYRESRTASGAWDIIEFPLRAFEADEDVDEDDLEAYGPLKGIMSGATFMFPTDPDADNDRAKTLDRLKTFLLDTLQLDDEDGEKTIKELCAEATGSKCYGLLSWREDGDEIRIDTKRYTPYE